MIQRLHYEDEWIVPNFYGEPEPREQRIIISEEYDNTFVVLDASMDGPAWRLADLPRVISALQAFQQLYEARKLHKGE